MSNHLRKLRQHEIEMVLPLFRRGERVLELGGGSGYQAKLLSDAGCEVSSIDVAGYPVSGEMHFPVQLYDGRVIPFRDAEFDVVFSSNVLEHVPHLDELLTEVSRVLKPGGTAVHVLPSAEWRFWTSVSHYLYLVKFLITRKHSIPTDAELPCAAEAIRSRGLPHMLKKALFPAPHGEYPNAVAELYYFSRRRWRGVFQRHGFAVEKAFTTRAYYSGYGLLPGLSMGKRIRAAAVLGSACNVFVLRKRG